MVQNQSIFEGQGAYEVYVNPQNIERTPKLLAEDEPEVAQKRAKAGNQDRLAKTSGSNLSAQRSIFLPSYFVMILLLSLK